MMTQAAQGALRRGKRFYSSYHLDGDSRNDVANNSNRDPH